MLVSGHFPESTFSREDYFQGGLFPESVLARKTFSREDFSLRGLFLQHWLRYK